MDYPSLPNMPREARCYGNRGDACVRELMMMAEHASLAGASWMFPESVFSLIYTNLIIAEVRNLHYRLSSRSFSTIQYHFQAYQFSYYNNLNLYHGIELCYKNIKPFPLNDNLNNFSQITKRTFKYSKTITIKLYEGNKCFKQIKRGQ